MKEWHFPFSEFLTFNDICCLQRNNDFLEFLSLRIHSGETVLSEIHWLAGGATLIFDTELVAINGKALSSAADDAGEL